MSDHWQPVTLDDPEPAPLTAWEPRKWKVGDRVRVRRPAECRFCNEQLHSWRYEGADWDGLSGIVIGLDHAPFDRDSLERSIARGDDDPNHSVWILLSRKLGPYDFTGISLAPAELEPLDPEEVPS